MERLAEQSYQFCIIDPEGDYTTFEKRGDYSRWLRVSLQDETLAGEVEEIEKQGQITPRESRERIRARIEERYTAPA